MSDTTAFLNGREQEYGVIAALLKRTDKFSDLEVDADDFGFYPYGWAFTAIGNLIEAGMTVDQITVGDELERMGKLEEFKLHSASYSGRYALSRLRESSNPAALMTYAENVRDYSAKRRLGLLFTEGYNHATNGRRAADIVADTIAKLAKFETRKADEAGVRTMREIGASLRERTRAARDGEITFIDTGLDDVDRALSGIEDTEFVIVAARPGIGKTAWLATVANHNLDAGKRVIIFELEMSSEQLLMRLVSMRSGISYDKQKTGRMSVPEWELWDEALTELENNPNLVICDLGTINPQAIRRIITKRGPFDLIIVDYIGLAQADGRPENRVQEVSQVSRAMKLMAKDFRTPVLCASQLNRSVEQRADKRPQLSDLKESGSLEQDADTVLFLHRESMNSNETDFIVAKRRNGPIGYCKLFYSAVKTKFENPKKISPGI
jgi:replicative DNA helicase